MKYRSIKKPAFLMHPVLRHARFSKINLTIFVLVFAAIGSYILLSSHAASFTANVFVSPNGSDSGANCIRFATAQANPDPSGASDCATPAKAWSLAQSGDIISLADGDYTGGTTNPNWPGCVLSGTKTTTTTITGTANARLICFLHIEGTDNLALNGVTVQRIYSNGAGGANGATYDGNTHPPANDVTITNVTVTCADSTPWYLDSPANRCSAQIGLSGSNYKLTNVTVGPQYDSSACGGTGDANKFPVGGTSTFTNVTFYDARYQGMINGTQACGHYSGNETNPQHTENVFLTGATGLAINGCRIYNDSNSGRIDLAGTPDGSGPDTTGLFMSTPGPSNFSLNNCLFYGPRTGLEGDSTAPLTNTLIENNTFVAGMTFQCDSTHCPSGYQSLTLRNNISATSSGLCPIGAALGSSGGNMDDHNLWWYTGSGGSASQCGASNLTTTPAQIGNVFNSYTTGDYSLKAGSPAIDTADSVYFPSTDINGTSRPQGPAPDIGAYEYITLPEVWVSTTGNDSTCLRGDQTKPCASFLKACSIAAGGDTILIADGTYGPQDLSSCTGKTSTVIFKPVDGHECPYSAATNPADLPGQNSDTSCKVTINGSLNMYDQSYTAMTTPASIVNSSLKNLEFIGMYAKTISIGFSHAITLNHMAATDFYVAASDTVTIQNSDFGNTFNGDCSTVANRANTPTPYPDSSNVIIEGNIFHDSMRLTSSQSHPDGLFIQGLNGGLIKGNVFYRDAVLPLYLNSVAGGSIQNITIINNVIHSVVDMTGTGSSTLSSSGISPQAISLGDNAMSNITVAYNSLEGYIRRQDNSPGGSGTGPTANLQVYGNIALGMVWQAGTWGCGDNATYDYNYWYGTSAVACGLHDSASSGGLSPYTANDTWTASGSYFTVTPGDYRLKTGSTPIDYIPATWCSTNSGICPSTDFNGVARPQANAYDAGAIEYVAGSPAPPSNPSPPSNPPPPATMAKKGDCNGDNIVNLTDLSILLSHYGTNYTAAEFDGGSLVGLTDLSILLSNYGK